MLRSATSYQAFGPGGCRHHATRTDVVQPGEAGGSERGAAREERDEWVGEQEHDYEVEDSRHPQGEREPLHVTGREFEVAASAQAPAVGSAMYGAVAAGAASGGYDSIQVAAAAMAAPGARTYRPDREASAVYDELYREYRTLHDYFGRGSNDVMKTLKKIRARQAKQVETPPA